MSENSQIWTNFGSLGACLDALIKNSPPKFFGKQKLYFFPCKFFFHISPNIQPPYIHNYLKIVKFGLYLVLWKSVWGLGKKFLHPNFFRRKKNYILSHQKLFFIIRQISGHTMSIIIETNKIWTNFVSLTTYFGDPGRTFWDHNFSKQQQRYFYDF